MSFCALTGGAMSCAVGEVDEPRVDDGLIDDDSGGEPGAVDEPDGGSDPDEPDGASEPGDGDEPDEPDGGDGPGGDDSPEIGGAPTAAPSAGGATLQTPNHQIRLIVGPRGGAKRVDTAEHRIFMGAGAAQHGQRRD